MKSIILIVLLFFLGVKASALSKEDSIRAYYNNVLEAEYYCIHKDYKDAIKCYNKAFDYKKAFATDIYNLMLCALDMKDNAAVLNCAEHLVKKGAPLPFFEQSLFTNFKSSQQYVALQTKYEDWHKEYLAAINQPLIEYINKLIALDQNVHCGLKVRYEDTAFVNAMHNNDDSLAIILSDLLLKNNYLDEDIVGVTFENDTVLRREPRYGLIALHQIQRGGKILTEAMNAAMKEGHLRSEIGLEWLSQTMGSKLNLTRLYMIYNDTLWKTRESELEAKMYQKMICSAEERTRILSEVYLDNEYFNVEERIVYNFYSKCDDCTPQLDKSFFILPKSWSTRFDNTEYEIAWIKRNHEQCDVLAYK